MYSGFLDRIRRRGSPRRPPLALALLTGWAGITYGTAWRPVIWLEPDARDVESAPVAWSSDLSGATPVAVDVPTREELTDIAF
jgi:hypothetical protein